ncbi:MAG: acyl-CoA dehydrogenase [Desulfobacterales bacterium]|nr:acyl-CoA dehydrogenase [Desulfobacterales bacterium]
MADKFISRRNLDFLLYEVLDAEQLTAFDYYGGHNRKLFDMVIDAAAKLAKDRLRPIFEEMDRQGPVMENGRVKVHPAVGGILREYGDGGWISASLPEAHGGEQLPDVVSNLCRFIFAAANYSASIYPELSAGAAHLIVSFGSEDLNSTYVPAMISGKWQGTMALTEPDAGSSLTDITTTAEPAGDFYRICGTKIFISAGDHDGAENVVHLMLAKIPGGPPGVKGISLFVVPRLRPGADGTLTPNDVTVTQIFHKLGYRGAPITELSMGEKGDCRGYLVGEPHLGLTYMFQLMNEARLGVGLGATAIAAAAYYAALDYARTRPQGRPMGEKDPTRPQVPIVSHADVRRMLLFQKSVSEGALALIAQCSLYSDLVRAADGETAERAALLLDLLTPVAKTYPSEMGVLSTSSAIQCFGGYGYCEDFPVEQHYRDVRIHPIHEGTTGIQGMDLLGRKVVMNGGRAMTLFLEEVKTAIAQGRACDRTAAQADQLEAALGSLEQVTWYLVGVAGEKGPEVFLADATLYLELFGIVTVAWQWLRQALAAEKGLALKPSPRDRQFYAGKRFAFRYFFAYELPKTLALVRRLTDGDPVTIEMAPEMFND